MTLKVVAAIVVREGRVLLSRRPGGTHLAGLWEFPGGKVEAGEGEREALARELREELGVEAEIARSPEARITHRYPEKEVSIAFYRCRLRPGSHPRAIEVAEVRWVGGRALANLPMPEADRPVVAGLVDEFT